MDQKKDAKNLLKLFSMSGESFIEQTRQLFCELSDHEFSKREFKIFLKKERNREEILLFAKCERNFSVISIKKEYRSDPEFIVADLISNFTYLFFCNNDVITKEMLIEVSHKSRGLDLMKYYQFFNKKGLMRDKDIIISSLSSYPGYVNICGYENDRECIKILISDAPELALNWLHDEEIVFLALDIRPSLYFQFPKLYQQKVSYFYKALKSQSVVESLSRRVINNIQNAKKISSYYGYHALTNFNINLNQLKYNRDFFIQACQNEVDFKDLDHLNLMIDHHGHQVFEEILKVNQNFPHSRDDVIRYADTINLRSFFKVEKDLPDQTIVIFYKRMPDHFIKVFVKKIKHNILLIKKLVELDRKIVKYLYKFSIDITSGYHHTLLNENFIDVIIDF